MRNLNQKLVPARAGYDDAFIGFWDVSSGIRRRLLAFSTTKIPRSTAGLFTKASILAPGILYRVIATLTEPHGYRVP